MVAPSPDTPKALWSPANPERDAAPVSREAELERTLRDVARAVRAAYGRAFLGDRERKVFELLAPYQAKADRPWATG